jgi:hypothetical protein
MVGARSEFSPVTSDLQKMSGHDAMADLRSETDSYLGFASQPVRQGRRRRA